MHISAIIPAYNEESTISNIINVLKKVNSVNEIIVVSDGSEDNTVFVSKKCGAKVVELSKNMGKGAAVKAGLENCQGDIIILLDADLVGLNVEHVNKLLKPVIENSADMTIGIFNSGRFSTDLAQKIAPQLSGQRVAKRYILDSISNIEMTGYGIEVALTKYVQKENVRVAEVCLNELTHVMKEEKLGLAKGFRQRIKMYWQIYQGLRLAKR
jgi:glycosyltransferase involved in cell wall biosynthesis